jgi:hypothetical protein
MNVYFVLKAIIKFVSLSLCLNGDTTLSITTLSITTFTISTLSIKCLYATLSVSDSQHKQHSGKQCSAVMLSVASYLS